MIIDDGVPYEFHWPSPSAEAKAAAKQFWLELGQVPSGPAADKRANELLFTVQFDGRITCTATCYVAGVEQIGEPMYHYRTMTLPSTRQRRIAANGLKHAFDVLSDYNLSLAEPEAKGIYMEIENVDLMRARPRALWLNNPYSYIGRTRQGWHQRLRYFDWAKLSRAV